MKPLSYPYRAEVALTSRCNLRCGYCHFFDSANDVVVELSTEEWLKVFDEFGGMKVMRVTLSGGEALMREDLPELVDGICRNNMRFSLLSNGYAFTGEHAAMLRRSGRCQGVQISLDGLEGEHDAARGQGSFRRALRAVGFLREYGIPLHIRITVGKHNYRSLDQTVRYLVETLGIDSIACNLAQHFSGKTDLKDQPYLLSMREELEATVTALRLRAAYPEIFSLRETTFARFSRDWPRMIRSLREKRPPIVLDCCASKCHAQNEKIFIRADGAVTPCNHLPDAILGYVGRDRLAELWKNSAALQALRAPARRLDEEFPLCRDCEYSPYCYPTAHCLDGGGYASYACLRRYREAAPDFDFEELKWRNEPSN